MKVLITGATGLIGRELGKALVQRGDQVFVLSRNVEKAREELPFPCEIIEGPITEAPLKNPSKLRFVDAVVNLAGESVAGRWSESKKRKIYESRILGTRNLIESLPIAPKVFISASAVGYYGSQGDQEIIEDGVAGEDFLAQVCQDWEEELLTFSYAEGVTTTRVVALRIGTVLAPHGGAFAKLLPLFRRGLGSVLGDGRQWMSWIHIEDVVGLILHALNENAWRGPINGVAPQPVTNEEFTKTLASVLGVSLMPTIPALALWASLGEMATLVLSSRRVLPNKALSIGYKFKYPELQKALEHLCPPQEGELLVFEQYLPWPPEKVFPFFSRVRNLPKMAPPGVGLEILGNFPEEFFQGSEVSYRLKLHGVPFQWKSVIQDWSPPFCFTDRQVRGPLKTWIHHHEFKAFGPGTLMRDQVQFRLPLGFLGSLLGGALVRKEIGTLLQDRRRQVLKNLQRELGPPVEAG